MSREGDKQYEYKFERYSGDNGRFFLHRRERCGSVGKPWACNKADLGRVEQALRTHANVSVLVNNAGVAMSGDLTSAAGPDRLESMIQLNVLAPSLLALATIPGFFVRGRGTLINMRSVLGLVPEIRYEQALTRVFPTRRLSLKEELTFFWPEQRF